MLNGKVGFLKARVSNFTGRKGDAVEARYITLLLGSEPIEFGATQEAYNAAKDLAPNAQVSVEVNLFRDFKGVLKGRVETLSVGK